MNNPNPEYPTAKVLFLFFLSMTAFLTSALSTCALADESMEKCYGIAKAGMNDCGAHSCAGSSTKDKQPDAYLMLPKGLCSKIVDGKLTPPSEKKP